MKKLTTMFAMAAMTTALAMGGCKKKPEEKKAEPVTKTTEEKPMGAGETKPSASEIPTECVEYKAAVEKLRNCEKLPQASRDALKQAYDQNEQEFSKVTPENRSKIAAACKGATEAVNQAAAQCM